MRNPIGLRFSTWRLVVLAAAAPACLIVFWRTRYWWAGIAIVSLVAILALVTFSGRRVSGWARAAVARFWRRRRELDVPSEPVVGATVKPGDHVAVRWHGDFLVSVIELIPRPFTPTVIVDGHAHTDDLLDTRLLEQLLSVHCPDLEAEVVSAGHRVGATATPEVVNLYQQVIGEDPAPANRRTWIVLHAHPERSHKSAQRRDVGVAGMARYLVASTTRIADQLASHGVDAVCCRSFDDYDHATDVDFVCEKWSVIQGRDSYTAAYIPPCSPDKWWSTQADRTIARVLITPGMAPRSTVLLTTAAKSQTPRGFSRLFGGQRTAALVGQGLVTDHHVQLPIGSAGVLVGETLNNYPVYMPFDDIDVSISLPDAQTFAQFAVRAAAAGGIVTVGPQFGAFAELIGAHVGPEAKVAWPNATTYLGPHQGVERVVLRHNVIGTPRHRELPIRRISTPEESRYESALPQ